MIDIISTVVVHLKANQIAQICFLPLNMIAFRWGTVSCFSELMKNNQKMLNILYFLLMLGVGRKYT